MTTIIQSCLETQYYETTTVKLKVAPPKTLEFSTNIVGNTISSINHDSKNWSFLHVLNNVSSNPKPTMEKENVYIHPLQRQYSSSRMSQRSLELCTENLGSETGTCDIMDINILSLTSSNSQNSSSKQEQRKKMSQEVETISSITSTSKYNKVVNNSRNFPPPLTTISGSNSLQFRPHREDGRLVIEAVEAPWKHKFLQAERSHGRLRLSFLVDKVTDSGSNSNSTRAEEVQEDGVANCEDEYEVGPDCETEKYSFEDEDYHQLEQEDDDQEFDDEEMAYTSRRDMDGNIFNVGVEMGRENFQMLMNSRCNEGGHGHHKGLCNWPEPLWVATS